MARAWTEVSGADHAELRSGLLGGAASSRREDYFDQYFALGAPKGVQSSVSLLYYDYVGMFVKAMQAAGTVDDTDKIAAELGR